MTHTYLHIICVRTTKIGALKGLGCSSLLPPTHTDPNVCTKDGLTPLHFAARHLPRSSDTVTEAQGASDAKSTSRQVIQLLLRADGERVGSKKIDHKAKDNQGITPLHMACSRGNVPAVQELLKYIKGILHLCVCVSV